MNSNKASLLTEGCLATDDLSLNSCGNQSIKIILKD